MPTAIFRSITTTERRECNKTELLRLSVTMHNILLLLLPFHPHIKYIVSCTTLELRESKCFGLLQLQEKLRWSISAGYTSDMGALLAVEV